MIYSFFSSKSLWFWHVRIFYHKLSLYICVCLKITSSTLLLSRARFRDLQSRGYYWSLISPLMNPLPCQQVICKDLPNTLDFLLSVKPLTSSFFSLPVLACAPLRHQNQTTVSAQSSELCFRITADSAADAELVCSGSSGDQFPTSGPVTVSWTAGPCPHFFTMSDSCSSNTLQPTQPACHC